MRYDAQHFDERTFARARHASDAHANGIARVGQALFQHILRQFDVFGAQAFDQGDGLAEDGAVAAQHTFDIRVAGQARAAAHCTTVHGITVGQDSSPAAGVHVGLRAGPGGPAQTWRSAPPASRLPHIYALSTGAVDRALRISCAASGITVPGPIDAGYAALVQEIVILRRNHAAHDHQDVVAAQLFELFDDLRHQRIVARRQRRNTQHVHVVLDGVARHFARRLKQRADIHVEPQIGERGGDHLGAAVVAVLSHLGHQHARPAALGSGEFIRHVAGLDESFRPSCSPRSRRRKWCG